MDATKGPAVDLWVSGLTRVTIFASRVDYGCGGDGDGDGCVAAVQAALKQDLADAMATCEELDQTVTDLTDDLYAKVVGRFMEAWDAGMSSFFDRAVPTSFCAVADCVVVSARCRRLSSRI